MPQQPAPDTEPLEELDTLDLPSQAIEQYARNSARKLWVFVILGVALFVAVRFTPLGEHISSVSSLKQMFQSNDWRTELYFVLLSAFLIMVGVPRLLFCALAGAAFGLWDGLWTSTLASVLGSFVAFRAARWGGRDWLTQRFGQHRLFSRIVHAKPTIGSVFLIRLLPVSNAIINVGLALSKVRNTAFLLGSLLGFLPQGVLAVLIGSGVTHDAPWMGGVQIGVVIVVVAAAAWYARKRRQ